jgi:hypothetical protein
VRFVDFLRSTVLLSAGAATALAAITVLSAGAESDTETVAVAVGWWLIAGVIGSSMGRRAQTSSPIERLLAGAQASSSLPELHPGAILLNRLWPLALFTLLSGALAFLARHRGRLRDHLGARLAPPGRGGRRHRGARRRVLLRPSHLARAPDGAGAHAGLQSGALGGRRRRRVLRCPGTARRSASTPRQGASSTC